MKRKIITISVIVAIALTASVGYSLRSYKQKESFEFVSTPVTKGRVSRSITATGTIEPVTEVEVGTQVSGIISKIYVDYNSVVKKGELIAEMDKVNLQSELLSAKANYDGAEAEYNYQKRLFERNNTLHEKQLISDTEYENSLYNYQRAQSTLAQSKATLAKAERNLSYASITSPIDGVVTSRDVEEVQTVASGFSTPTLFTIAADLTKMQVVADVDEADIAGITEGNKVSFTVDAYPDDLFEGTVKQVRLGSALSSSTSTSSSNAVVTYEVVIIADNPDYKLKPRLTANATIYIEIKEGVTLVPNKALRFTPTPEIAGNRLIKDCESTHKVWLAHDDCFEAIPIEIGISDGNMTEVVKGIAANEAVITSILVKEHAKEPKEEAMSEEVEQNPFMPGPPGSRNQRNKK